MIKGVGLIINNRKKQPVLLGKILVNWFREKDIKVFAPEEDILILGMNEENILKEASLDIQCVVTLGGDGTLLRAARMMSSQGIPILGVNMGALGFLTEIEVAEVEDALEKLIQGDFWLENRIMLETQVVRQNEIVTTMQGLNDVVISKGHLARLVALEIFVGDDYFTTYKADGIIVASPTGSTAYSLSAGGPIVYPDIDVTILTPICPHTLHSRALVVPSDKKIRVIVHNKLSDSMLTIDGQYGFKIEDCDEIIISKASYCASLVRIKRYNFLHVLRGKLTAEGQTTYE